MFSIFSGIFMFACINKSPCICFTNCYKLHNVRNITTEVCTLTCLPSVESPFTIHWIECQKQQINMAWLEVRGSMVFYGLITNTGIAKCLYKSKLAKIVVEYVSLHHCVVTDWYNFVTLYNIQFVNFTLHWGKCQICAMTVMFLCLSL